MAGLVIERVWWDSAVNRWRWLYVSGDFRRSGQEYSRAAADAEVGKARSEAGGPKVASRHRWSEDTPWKGRPPAYRPHVGPL